MDVGSSSRAPQHTLSVARMALLLLIAATAMGNGLHFSPYFDKWLHLTPKVASAFFVKGAMATYYATGFALWTLTLAAAGVPAALWERVRRLPGGSIETFVIWLLGTIALSFRSWLEFYELFFEP